MDMRSANPIGDCDHIQRHPSNPICKLYLLRIKKNVSLSLK
jgi:hypothetical protein